MAADPAVAAAARRGVAWARERGAAEPWLMVSLSDGADPHFRKAWFDPRRCPADCPRPCERVCPALAIGVAAIGRAGVLAERCYGCGRCLPACPAGLIRSRDQVLSAEAVPPLLVELAPDAIELHTRIGRGDAFAARLEQVRASGVALRRLAVSCGLEPAAGADPADIEAGQATPEQLASELWQRFTALRARGLRPLWQLDGRPMSGDVGAGMAHAAVQLLERIAPMAPPGPLQLAGGTNHHTLERLDRLGRRWGRPRAGVGGVAFGGVARSLLQPLLLEAQARGRRLLDEPRLWPRALAEARGLVRPWLSAAAAPGRPA